MSYEEFLAWADEDVHAEWANGEAIVFGPPSIRHQSVRSLLSTLLVPFVRVFNLGMVLTAPVMMRATPDGPAREPDTIFVAAEHLDRVTEQRLVGPADLVVEIISTESARRDRAEKFYEYQEAGIAEYLLLDPRRGKERVDLYRLTEEGKYLATLPDNEGHYHSAVLPGFWFHPSWFWQEPAPDPLLLLAEMAPAALQQALATLEARQRNE
jgi:Uma2 family endonuclease